jgi:nitrite reductase (cytochrome c-552)
VPRREISRGNRESFRSDETSQRGSRRHQRRAQFLLDFIEAENSMGFHADQEAVRVLALSIDETRRGQASLTGGKATPGSRTPTTPAVQPQDADRVAPAKRQPR